MKTLNITSPIKFESHADIQENELLTWISFVFADNQPNGNGQGIPKSAFGSLVETGSYMPIKMEEGRIGGHSQSTPLGVVKDLNISENKVLGNAALWNDERPADVSLLKESQSKGTPAQISFELFYTESLIDDGGVEWLQDPSVKAATIVIAPAYLGRTPITAIAEMDYSNWSDECFAYIAPGGVTKDGITSPQSLRYFPYKDEEGKLSKQLIEASLTSINQQESFVHKEEILDLLTQTSLKLQEEQKSSMDNEKIQELEEAQATLRQQIEDLTSEVTILSGERDTLQEWKTTREQEEAEAELLKLRIAALTEAGFTYTNEQVESKRSLWLGLDDDSFGSYVADLAEAKKQSQAELNSTNIPNVSGNSDKNALQIVQDYFKEKNKKTK